jgi:hypothetical protein
MADRSAIVLVACLLAMPVAGCIASEDTDAQPASVDAEAEPETIGFEKVHHPEEIRELVDELGERDEVAVERIGTSLEGRAIQLVTVGEGELETWIVGRQHGDEPTGGEAIVLTLQALTDEDAQLPEDAPAIVQTLREHREQVLEEVTFHFVPVANPDGAAAYQRGTATGADPNRDHFAFTHPFSRALREAFWQIKPDACLDLHNMGTGSTDFDAYGAEGPLMESELYEQAVADANLAVREVDAAGGNGGLYNENYRAPAPADDEPNPTAYHPGTHDVFCTSRGAPGWTPEGAIEGGDNGATDDVFAWSTRLHQATVAAHALHLAGAYEATEPDVWKEHGVAEPTTTHTYELDEAGDVEFRAVYRSQTSPGDHNALPVRFTVTGPDGSAYEGRTPHPEAWTSTVKLDDAPAGTYELSLQGASQAAYEVRAYAHPDEASLVAVERTDAGLQVSADGAANGSIEVDLSDVFDPADVNAASFAPAAEEVHALNGTATDRTVAEWTLRLEPGEQVTVEEPDALEAEGPYRFTATDGDRLQSGVQETLNPAEN